MGRLGLARIEGFEEFKAKLKRLPDKVKRREVLAIQKRAARPVRAKYAAALPKASGTLSRSVAIRALSSRRANGNPAIFIRPGKRGKNDAYYQFMVIRKGARPGSRKRGSRKGLNDVVKRARDRALRESGPTVIVAAEKDIAAYLKKRISRL